MKTFRFLPILLTLACSTGPGEVRSPSHALPPEKSSARLVGNLPREAFDRLNESTTSSCDVCVRRLRKEAVEILDDHYPPGAILMSDSQTRLARAPGSENELALDPRPGEAPRLTFRFHTPDDHLVGVSETDLTETQIAERVLSAPEGAAFQAKLAIVAFAYGDGASFLYHPSSHHVQVHCRILEIARE